MFYDQLLKICEEKGLSVPKVMESIGSTRFVAYSWKKRGTTPNAETVRQLAQVLNCSMSDLLDGEITEPKVTDDDIKFALFGGDAAEITEEQFEEVKRFAKFVAERNNNK